MHISRLMLNPRSAQGRKDIVNPYEMHRTILRAFDGRPERILWRRDDAVVLVQSDVVPNWNRVTDRFPDYAECDHKPYDILVSVGQYLGFRLRANPTKRLGKSAGNQAGKRVGIHSDQFETWLACRFEQSGGRLVVAHIVNENLVTAHKGGENGRMKFASALFTGVVEITDNESFLNVIKSGIGTAKGFGFGLLSLAPT